MNHLFSVTQCAFVLWIDFFLIVQTTLSVYMMSCMLQYGEMFSMWSFRWAQARHEELKLRGSSLEFRLHKLKFLDLLKEGRHKDALVYSRNFAQFASDHTKGTKKFIFGQSQFVFRIIICM